MNRKVQILKVCGRNECHQLAEESNDKDFMNDPIINPPLDLDFDISKISSYSIYISHAIVITYDGEIFAMGNNEDGQIFKSLPINVFEKLTKFEIKDSEGQIWKPISAVCGDCYTLYMVSDPKNEDDVRLLLSCSDLKSDFPLFLDTHGLKPVALFGDCLKAAAIVENGSIILIDCQLRSELTTHIHFREIGEKVVSIAFLFINSYIVLTTGGNLYQIITPCKKIKFKRLFKGITFSNISGTDNHFFAVTDDGRIFVTGDNRFGHLGLSEDSKCDCNKFVEITSLPKIKAAYAGSNHSLFLTQEGKVFGCGSNSCGELPGVKRSTDRIYLPVETSIAEGATFCIAGSNLSAIFFGDVPPKTPNQKISFDKEPDTSAAISVTEENAQLKAEISRLQSEIESLRHQLAGKGCKQPNKIEIIDQKTINELTRVGLIGKGAQSDVYKVTRPQEFALKVLNLSRTPEKEEEDFEKYKKLLREFEILKALNHPNIVQSFSFCLGDETNSPSILMQFCPHNLSDVIKGFTIVQQICSIFEICLGMEAVHSAQMIHRDLKPENILIDADGHVKISDFGVSCIVEVENQTRTAGVIGSIKFMAPELLNESDHYNNKVDVYSFGVVVYFILTNGDLPRISLAAQSNGKKAPIPNKINKVSRDLINRCWSHDEKDRPSFSEIIGLIKKNNFNLIDGSDAYLSEIKSFLNL